MKTEEKLNMTMLCDFYELTMATLKAVTRIISPTLTSFSAGCRMAAALPSPLVWSS